MVADLLVAKVLACLFGNQSGPDLLLLFKHYYSY